MPVAPAISVLSPAAPFLSAWRNRALILRLARREIEARYRGTAVGMVWSVLTPILMVAVYSFVFSYVFQPRWMVPPGTKANFVLLLYSGLLVFNLLGDCLARAPMLVLETPSYVKKVVFPLEILPWIALAGALFNFLVGMGLLLGIYLILYGLPPVTILLLPLVLLPLVLLTLGLGWLLAALGVYLRDLRHVVGILVSMLMFLSPIFYPADAVGEGVRSALYANPLTPVLEMSKDVLFWGRVPDAGLLTGGILAAWMAAWLGHAAFMKLRAGFADVL